MVGRDQYLFFFVAIQDAPMSADNQSNVSKGDILNHLADEIGKKFDLQLRELSNTVQTLNPKRSEHERLAAQRLLQCISGLSTLAASIKSLKDVLGNDKSETLTPEQRALTRKHVDDIIKGAQARRATQTASAVRAETPRVDLNMMSEETQERLRKSGSLVAKANDAAPSPALAKGVDEIITNTVENLYVLLEKFGLTYISSLLVINNDPISQVLAKNVFTPLRTAIKDPTVNPYRWLVQRLFSPEQIAAGAAFEKSYIGNFAPHFSINLDEFSLGQGLFGRTVKSLDAGEQINVYEDLVLDTERFLVKVKLNLTDELDDDPAQAVEVAPKYTPDFVAKTGVKWYNLDHLPAEVAISVVEDLAERLSKNFISA